MNSVIGYYNTKFGELWSKSLYDLINETIKGTLENSSLEASHIDGVFLGNMLGGIVENQLLSSAVVSEILGKNIPVYRLESACASGGMAFQLAHSLLENTKDRTYLVLGAEKMTDVSAEFITQSLGGAASQEEQNSGLTFPGLYGMMAQVYLDQFHYTEEHLAYVSVKNHFHGVLNDKAHFRREVTVEQILKSPYVAYPLKVLNSSAISDGAAGVVITNNQSLIKKSKYHVNVLASEIATDCISLKNRKSLVSLEATKIAGQKAFQEAKVQPKDINIAELHDCFSIAEIFAMEDLGFWKKGEGGARSKEMETQFGSGNSIIVNTSGGLKAAGHPVGATGVKQIGEVFLQLTGQAEKRQIQKAKFGLTHNVGGSGGVAVVTILGS